MSEQAEVQPKFQEMFESGKFEKVDDFDSIEKQSLHAGEGFYIDTDQPLVKTPRFNVVAAITTGENDDNSFLVLDIRKSRPLNILRRTVAHGGDETRYPFGKQTERRSAHSFGSDVDFILVGANFNPEGRTKAYKAIRQGKENGFVVGRRHFRDRFIYHEHGTSREHFKIGFDDDGKLYIKDVGSRKGTKVKANEDQNATWANLSPEQRNRRIERMRQREHEQQVAARKALEEKRQKEQARLREARERQEAIREQLRQEQARKAAEQEARRKAAEGQEARRRERQTEQDATRDRQRGTDGNTRSSHDWRAEEAAARRRADAIKNPQAAADEYRRLLEEQAQEKKREILREIQDLGIEARLRGPVQMLAFDHQEVPIRQIAVVVDNVMSLREEGLSDTKIYRRLQRQFHPDMNDGEDVASKMIEAIYDKDRKQIAIH